MFTYKRLSGIPNHGSLDQREESCWLSENRVENADDDLRGLGGGRLVPSCKFNFPTVSPSPEKEAPTEVHGHSIRMGHNGRHESDQRVSVQKPTFSLELSGLPEVS